MIALQLSEDRLSMMERRTQIIEGLHELPSQIKTVLAGDASLQSLASGVLANQRSLLIMGRGYQYVISFSTLTPGIQRFFKIRNLLGGCAQDQGNLLHALRRYPCRRAEARPPSSH